MIQSTNQQGSYYQSRGCSQSENSSSTDGTQYNTTMTQYIPRLPPLDRDVLCSGNFDNMNVVLNAIPHDLFPIHKKEITIQWAKNAFQYSHPFLSSSTINHMTHQQNLLEWMKTGESIVTKLKTLGIKHAEDEVLRLAKLFCVTRGDT